MAEASLSRILNPKSIAVVGGVDAAKAVRECQKLGFKGELWAINPGRTELAGIECFPRVERLPGVPDATLIAVSANATIEVVSQLSARNAGGAVCYASGFSEAGEVGRQQALLEAAGDMPFMGPNCYGFINAMNGAVLWPDWHGLRRVDSGVAIIAGSGNLAVNISMQDRSVPIALLATIGNQALVGAEQLMAAVIDDDRISAIGMHIEGLKDLSLFVQLAQVAAQKGKPVIALKTGRSEVGAQITLSHTATLAGSADLYDEMFTRLGVAIVHDLETFLEALKLVSVTGPLGGSRIASMSCSGGEASMIADLAQNTVLEFPAVTPEQSAQLRETLNDYVAISNPLDYHTFIWGDYDKLYKTFVAMLRGNYQLTLLLLDYPRMSEGDLNEWYITGDAFADACEHTGRAGAVVCNLPENMPGDVRDGLLARSIVPLLGMQQAVSAIAAAAQVGNLNLPVPVFPGLNAFAAQDPDKNPRVVSEYAAKQLLSDYQVPIPAANLVADLEAAEVAAVAMGFPVVLKASVAGMTHKTESRAVALNIESLSQLRVEGQRLLDMGGELLVEQMVPSGVVELLLGISFDPQFGHYLVLGIGGTAVELIADRQIMLLPASDDQIRAALGRLRMARLLTGYRDRAAADVDAVVACAASLAAFVADQRDLLLEVDINPLIVGAQGSGAKAVDALIVYRE
ncbi:MAG: acyl-CoA synthetase (NDP forming) [Cryomorphaceae bacterium]|jgi:acyl-CoA synthetase (NDP forming)